MREVIKPLAGKFPTPDGEKGFATGRLHSFRHYFCSTCANNRVPERIVMAGLGHANSEMIRHHYHLHDEESQRRMKSLDFIGGAGGRFAGQTDDELETVEPPPAEKSDDGDTRDCPSIASAQLCQSKTSPQSVVK